MPLLVVFFSIVLYMASQLLEARRQRLLAFLGRPVYELVAFDEVVWGIPKGRLPEATSWVVLAIFAFLIGAIGAITLGFGLVVLLRTAPLYVLPAMLFASAAVTAWRGLASQAGRVPVVQRLRLTQAHLVLDEVEVGLVPEDEVVESTPPSSHARTIAWADVQRLGFDDARSLVIQVRGAADAVFGPLPDDVAANLVRQIERRRRAEVPGSAQVIDLAQRRLQALRERAEDP